MKCTDEKNISLAMRGYKIFFASATLTSYCKPTTGLKINRKPVVGFNFKNCQLNSGRGTNPHPTILAHLQAHKILTQKPTCKRAKIFLDAVQNKRTPPSHAIFVHRLK